MKANIILILLSLSLLVTGSVCVGFMQKTATELQDIATLAAEALPDDPSAATEQLKRLEALWERTEPRWQFIAIHDDLSEVAMALEEAQDALLMDDIPTAKTACDHILSAIDTIMRKELPTPGNIF